MNRAAAYAHVVRHLKERRGLTIFDVAVRAEVSISTVNNIVRAMQVPSPTTARKVARAFGLDYAELVALVNAATEEPVAAA